MIYNSALFRHIIAAMILKIGFDDTKNVLSEVVARIRLPQKHGVAQHKAVYKLASNMLSDIERKFK